jgi:NAD+ kinase
MGAAVTFVVHGERQDAIDTATKTASVLNGRGISAEIVALSQSDASEGGDLLETASPSLLVSLGGDGTFLKAARRAHSLDVPVLGVNFGRVGYLLEVPPADLEQVIEEALAGSVSIELRSGLRIALHQPGTPTHSVFAINEVSVEKTVPGHVVRLATSIDGEDFMTFSADGVLIATPMGSTAYNLSAGGPVLAPGLDGYVMTPVAPHFALNRSLVLRSSQVVTLDVVGDRPAVCVVDGVEVGVLMPGHRVVCDQEPRRLKVVTLAEPGLGARLRESLRQGHE